MTPATCPKCGAATFLGARFCRRCGSSLADAPPKPVYESTRPIDGSPVIDAAEFVDVAPVIDTARAIDAAPPTVVETISLAAAAPPLPPSRAVMASATEVQPPPPPPATAVETRVEPAACLPATRLPPGPRPARGRGRGLALVGGVAAIFAIAAGVTYLARGSGGTAADASGQAAKRGTPTPSAATSPTPTATLMPELASPSSGRFMRLGSFRYQSAAQREADALHAKGIDAQVIASDDAEGMFPAFFQVVEGPIAAAADERRALRAAKRAGVAGPFVSELTRATGGRPSPRDLTGDFSGSLQQNNAKVKRLNRKLATTMSFAPDGRSGTVSYGRPRCEGTLTRVPGRGRSFAFREQIDTGRCVSGGTWHMRLESGRLWATWWRPGDVTFVIGTLDR